MTIHMRTCNLCNEKMTGGEEGFIKHGLEKHPDHYLSGCDSKSSQYKFVEKNFFCPLDNKWYSSRKYLARTIKSFGLTNEKYFLDHGEKYMPNLWHELHNDEKYGDAYSKDTCLQCNKKVKFTEMKWYYPAFCGFSCSTTWHAHNTDRIDQAMTTLKDRKAIDPNHHLRPNQKQYWINKGHTDEEAIELVKKRQHTFSKEILVDKYGEEEAFIRLEARDKKWTATRVERKCFTGTSVVEMEMFDNIAKIIPDIKYGNNKEYVKCHHNNGKKRTLKPDGFYNNRIIENRIF